MSGLFQIIFGLVKGGAIGDYFPTAVIKGMLAAIGLILILKQYPNAFNKDNLGVNIISAIALFIMLGWEKLPFKLMPGALVAVVTTVIVNQVFHLVGTEHLVKIPDAVFSSFKLPSFENFSLAVVGVAITISIVGSLETLLCVDAADRIDPLKRKTNKNRELFAQGFGNMFSGILGGLPITAVIVRTSTNVTAGGKTKVSAIFHGVWILSLVLLIPNLLNLIPLATLACVLLLVGYKLTKPVFYVDMYKRGWEQLLIFCITIGGILATDLLKGIFIGLGAAIIFELKKPAMNCFEVEVDGPKVHVKFTKNVSFFHKAKIHQTLNDIPLDKHLFISGLQFVRVHVDVHELISEYHLESKKLGREISIS